MDIPKMMIDHLKAKAEPADYSIPAKKSALKKILFAIKHDSSDILEEALDELEALKANTSDPDYKYGPYE